MDTTVVLYEEGRGMWLGCRGEIESGEWLWGNAYGVTWHNGERWDCDNDCDHEYLPTLWHPLPTPPNDSYQP